MAKVIKTVICCIAIIVLAAGCAVQPQIKLHPELGTHLMVIPEGTKIGGQVTPEEGVFMSRSVVQSLVNELQGKTEREKRGKRI